MISNTPISFPDLLHLLIFKSKPLLIADIEYLRADRNYTHFYLCDGQHILVSKTLKRYEAMLLSHGFVRCHKSYLVNPAHIVGRSLELIHLRSGKTIQVARRRREATANQAA